MKLTFFHKLLISILLFTLLAAGAWYYLKSRNPGQDVEFSEFLVFIAGFHYFILGLALLLILLKRFKVIRMHNIMAVFCLTANLMLAFFYFYSYAMEQTLELQPILLGIGSALSFISMMGSLRKEKVADERKNAAEVAGS